MRDILDQLGLPQEDDCIIAINSKNGGFRPALDDLVDSIDEESMTNAIGTSRQGGNGRKIRRGGQRSKVGNQNHDAVNGNQN